MTRRETRVVNAFIHCVESGEYSFDYAVLIIEDTERYGWLSDEAKDYFYAHFESEEPTPDVEE